MLTEFRFLHICALRSICSLSGLVSLRPSANPLSWICLSLRSQYTSTAFTLCSLVLHAHKVSLFAHSCTSLNLFAIRTRFTPSANPLSEREYSSCAKHTDKNLFTYLPILLFTTLFTLQLHFTPREGRKILIKLRQRATHL